MLISDNYLNLMIVNNKKMLSFRKQFKLRKFTRNNKISRPMTRLKEGMKAPSFEGIDQDGKTVRLSDFSGKKLVLYFYPKDSTPGCTMEACNLRDNFKSLLDEGFSIVGVSADSEKSHKNFALKYSLPFPLIADTSKTILNDYGVWKEKSLYGKTFLGIARTTFIINESGIIDRIIEKVETKKHAEQIFKLYK
jgi:thioredoxin-dependent peroxiredoxin